MKNNGIIRSREELAETVREGGFLPFFRNSIPGFSLEERVAPSLWFPALPGPWEWKGPLIRENGVVYGKFFEKKAVFMTLEWYKKLANFRRDGYDHDALVDDGKAFYRDAELYALIEANPGALSTELKALGGYGKNGKKGFDTYAVRLQMQGYVVTKDFSYAVDRRGKEYGWGVARLITPEALYGAAFTDGLYSEEPGASREALLGRLASLCPGASRASLEAFIR